jgi:hypothetical protein
MDAFQYDPETNTLTLFSFEYQGFNVRIVYWLSSAYISPTYLGSRQDAWEEVLDTDKFKKIYTKLIKEIYKDYTKYDIRKIAIKMANDLGVVPDAPMSFFGL